MLSERLDKAGDFLRSVAGALASSQPSSTDPSQLIVGPVLMNDNSASGAGRRLKPSDHFSLARTGVVRPGPLAD